MDTAAKFPPMLQKKEFRGKVRYKYMVSVPPTYENDPNLRWPTILFLHGAGECDSDLEVAKIHGIPRLVQVYDNWRNNTLSKYDLLNEESAGDVKEHSSSPTKPINLECAKFVAENFITITPQVNPKYNISWEPESLEKFLDVVEKDYRIDDQRFYVTGISMGGFGTFEMVETFPNKCAAIIPICGGGNIYKANTIKHIPIWVFHGEKDNCVPISCSEEIVRALKEVGGNVKFTVYPDADHDSWTATYNNIEIYKWLLEQKKKS